jgi:opacity protein-like surface antigen
MGVGYHFGRTDSEAANGDFDQHAFNLDFTTAITQKASLNFGYRYFLTNAYNSNFDFTQHRVILGLNYNF